MRHLHIGGITIAQFNKTLFKELGLNDVVLMLETMASFPPTSSAAARHAG